MNKKLSPDMCIGGEQCSAEMSEHQSQEVNGSAYACSRPCSDEEKRFSQSLGSDDCLFGASTTSLCMTGLHTCGDLTVDAIKLFFRLVSVKLLVMVPCCYHKMSLSKDTTMTEEKFSNFPLSSALCNLIRSSTFFDSPCFLRRPFLRLASQETASRWHQWSEEDHKQHSLQVMARAILQLYAHNGRQAIHKLRKSIKQNPLLTLIQNQLNPFCFTAACLPEAHFLILYCLHFHLLVVFIHNIFL
jgi:hypothetical protein